MLAISFPAFIRFLEFKPDDYSSQAGALIFSNHPLQNQIHKPGDLLIVPGFFNEVESIS